MKESLEPQNPLGRGDVKDKSMYTNIYIYIYILGNPAGRVLCQGLDLGPDPAGRQR